jgi:hypothetical protein
VHLPWDAFERSVHQPPHAPNDGLTLTEVWGYGLRLPDKGVETNPVLLDKVRTIQPHSVVVVNANDNGPGSLRQALALVANGGVVTFDPALAGASIELSTGPLLVQGKTVTIGASATPLTISGAGRDRMLIIDPGAGVNMSYITLANGSTWDVGGAVINNGSLSCDHCLVTNNFLNSGDSIWWKGGGGIFSGDGSTLRLINSTISNNRTNLVDGGGIYVRQGATVHIENSTISGNTAGNVGGGIRMLGSGSIINSTISGNTAVAWFGGALFHTDGVLGILNSTITANVSPAWGDAAIFVGTFTDASATLTLANTIVGDNVGTGCVAWTGGAGVVTLASGGNNLFTDGTCFPVAADLIVGYTGLDPLAANGGPTLTHLPGAGSAAIDAANAAVCPAADQRGVTRPQGAGCDIGSVEK